MVLFKALKFIFGAISFFIFLTFVVGLIIIGSITYKIVDTIIEDNDFNDGKWTKKFMEFKDRYGKKETVEGLCLLGGEKLPCEEVRNIGK